MNRHSYSLQKYVGTQSRHNCPSCGGKRCFTRYVDENGDPLSEEVGRCNHESGCGYHYTPADYFRDHPDQKGGHDWRELTYEERQRLLSKPKPQQPICTIPQDIVTRSVKPSYHSHLTQYLTGIIDPLVLEGVITEYNIGVTKDRDTIFFQIDAQGRCRTGKIMKYNPLTGHRIKDDEVKGRITWVHSLLKANGSLPKEWTLTQCLFGEHLLPRYPEKKVAIVESEKTAIICAALMPRFIWLATGGKTQLGDKLQVLKGRDVIAFPDVDGFDAWKQKLSCIPGPLDTASVIENKYAKSAASMRNGKLVHRLEIKPVDEPVIIDKQIVYRDSLVFVDRVEKETVEVERQLTGWQQIKLFLGGWALLALFVWIVYSIIHFLLTKKLISL